MIICDTECRLKYVIQRIIDLFPPQPFVSVCDLECQVKAIIEKLRPKPYIYPGPGHVTVVVCNSFGQAKEIIKRLRPIIYGPGPVVINPPIYPGPGPVVICDTECQVKKIIQKIGPIPYIYPGIGPVVICDTELCHVKEIIQTLLGIVLHPQPVPPQPILPVNPVPICDAGIGECVKNLSLPFRLESLDLNEMKHGLQTLLKRM